MDDVRVAGPVLPDGCNFLCMCFATLRRLLASRCGSAVRMVLTLTRLCRCLLRQQQFESVQTLRRLYVFFPCVVGFLCWFEKVSHESALPGRMDAGKSVCTYLSRA